MKTLKAWAVLDYDGRIVNWHCLSDGEEGLEIHRTKKLAEGSRMGNEKVVKVLISWTQ